MMKHFICCISIPYFQETYTIELYNSYSYSFFFIKNMLIVCFKIILFDIKTLKFFFFSDTLDIRDSPVYSVFPHESEVISMRVYEALSLMIAFATLIMLIISVRK